MKESGTKVVHRPVGETSGICCRQAIKRKNAFEYRLNDSKKNKGRKVKALYLVVLTTLEANLLCCCGLFAWISRLMAESADRDVPGLFNSMACSDVVVRLDEFDEALDAG